MDAAWFACCGCVFCIQCEPLVMAQMFNTSFFSEMQCSCWFMQIFITCQEVVFNLVLICRSKIIIFLSTFIFDQYLHRTVSRGCILFWIVLLDWLTKDCFSLQMLLRKAHYSHFEMSCHPVIKGFMKMRLHVTLYYVSSLTLQMFFFTKTSTL